MNNPITKETLRESFAEKWPESCLLFAYFEKNGTRIVDLDVHKDMLDFLSSAYDRIREEAIKETEKAFGGCTKCYGKGYNTQLRNLVGAEDFGGEGFESGPFTKLNYCSCERGRALRALNN